MTATIVIVDDNLDLLDLWDIALSHLMPEITVLLADTVACALRFLHENHVDLVVTDMEMPGQNGLDLIRIMKLAAPHVPVLVVTGSTEGRSIKKAAELGIIACLEKPLFPDELAAGIKRCLPETFKGITEMAGAALDGREFPAKIGS